VKNVTGCCLKRLETAIFIVDTEGENVGHIVNANEAAAAMHGFTTDELMD